MQIAHTNKLKLQQDNSHLKLKVRGFLKLSEILTEQSFKMPLNHAYKIKKE